MGPREAPPRALPRVPPHTLCELQRLFIFEIFRNKVFKGLSDGLVLGLELGKMQGAPGSALDQGGKILQAPTVCGILVPLT